MSAFSEQLLKLRNDRGMTQKQVGDPAQFDKSFISRLESADRRPDRDTVRYLADAMDLSAIETDRLLLAAGYAPVQAAAMLYCPELSTLDEWLASTGDEDAYHRVVSFVGQLLGYEPKDEAMYAAAV